MPSYLDETGLAYFWGKIKAYVNNAVSAIGALTGVKGDAEATYRTGNVNLTPADIGSPSISDLAGYLPLTGGTLTGKLTGTKIEVSGAVEAGDHFQINRDDLDVTATRDSTFEVNLARIMDQNGVEAGHVLCRQQTSGRVDLYLEAHSGAWNAIRISVMPDGTRSYGVSSPSAFRDALGVPSNADIAGIGDVVGGDHSTAVSVPTSTWKAIASVTLDPGTWVLSGGVMFGSSSNGRRYVAISPADGSVPAAYQRATQNTCPAISGGTVYLHTTYVGHVNSSTTYYLNAWQNNGGALSCTGFFRAVRII